MNLSETKAAIPPIRTQLAQAIHRLGILTGQEPTALSGLLGKPRPLPVLPASVTVGIPADMLRQRPDVRTAERKLAAANAMIGVRKAELYPTFSLPGVFVLKAYSASDLGGNALDYSFGPQFTWNLFSGGRVRSRIHIAEAQTREAEALYRQAVLKALEEVENTMVAIQEDREEIVHLGQAVKSAEESVKLVRSLYKSGLTDFQNVLTTERSLRGHQDRLANRKGLLAIDIVLLYKALGGGWTAAGGDAQQVNPASKTAEPDKETDQTNEQKSQEQEQEK
jgi:NodT family efflux transporter outer membrane factor (OMF) lipoprotein